MQLQLRHVASTHAQNSHFIWVYIAYNNYLSKVQYVWWVMTIWYYTIYILSPHILALSLHICAVITPYFRHCIVQLRNEMTFTVDHFYLREANSPRCHISKTHRSKQIVFHILLIICGEKLSLFHAIPKKRSQLPAFTSFHSIHVQKFTNCEVICKNIKVFYHKW